MDKYYDVVVIGAGSGGLTAAVGFSKVGKKVALIEREHMGGECTNTGCVPSKALLYRAHEYHQATTLAGASTKSDTYRSESLQYVRNIINDILEEETPETFQKLGIDVIMGEATFATKCSLTVGGDTYHYKHAVVATGSSPRLLNVPGLSEEDVLTNQNIFDLETIPKRTLIIGGGPIGMEMGQALTMLGSQVTIATRETEFAHLEDEALRETICESFAKLGIVIITDAELASVTDKIAKLTINSGGERDVPFDTVLVAIGRVPNLPAGLSEAGIATTDYGIQVDGQHRTSNKYVYALGDVAQKLKFTHTADDIARQVVARVASRGLFRLNLKKAVPKVTYTTPEIAQVGMSWEEAVKTYTEERIMRIEVPFSANDRAKTASDTDGKLVVIARRLNGAVLGAHIVGTGAGELISIFTLAIDQKISMWKLQKTIFAYPTYSLMVKKAGDYFVGTQLGNLKTDLGNLLKRNLPKLIAGLFWITLLVSFQNYRITNDLSYQDMLFRLLDFFTMSMYGPLIYMVLYAVRPLIFFPATLLTALSGTLFGPLWGIIYTIIGENASANFAYWIGRFFGKGLRLEDTAIGNWVEALRKRSFESVLLMRLFYVPFDLTNYGSGIVKAKWSEYFLATLIGIMPGLTVFVLLGASLDIEEFKMDGLTFDAFDPKFLALSVAIFIASLGLSRILKRWKAAE